MSPVNFVVVGFQYFNYVGAHHDVTVLEHTMMLGFSTLTVGAHDDVGF